VLGAARTWLPSLAPIVEADMQLAQIVGVGAVCAALSVSKPTLYRMIRRGDFPRPIRLAPQRVGWRREDVQKWIDVRAALTSGACLDAGD
jgi:prophage regulatory protein